MSQESLDTGVMNDLLRNVVSSSEAITALLITKEGTGIAEAGDISYLNTTAMAALVAGMFSATREVARMVGEKQFSILLQQGEKRHIHISLIPDSVMMVIIFENYHRIGLVRHEANKASKKIAEVLSKQETSAQDQEEVLTPQFKEYAMSLIDKIFD